MPSSSSPAWRASRPFLRADAGVEQRHAAVLLLDHVHVRRTARFGERDGDRDPVNPEAGVGARHFSLFTSSVSSGSALKRSATRPQSATWKSGASASLLMATLVL